MSTQGTSALVALCMGILAGCPASEQPTADVPTRAPVATTSAAPNVAPPATSAPAPAPPTLDPAAKWDGKWPLPQHAASDKCTTPSGEAGLTVNGKDCFNPCRAGMAPSQDGWACVAKCAADADCNTSGLIGTCRSGVCDRPQTLPCAGNKASAPCKTAEGEDGQRCEASDDCTRSDFICPSGRIMYGGTHCAKACSKPADCPQGTCEEGICGPLCPSEGCPYFWE
jgi:hypothetical protein